jgi:hypothetical protein
LSAAFLLTEGQSARARTNSYRKFPDRPKPAYVYFVRIGKFIKIGFTTNLRGRLKSFRGTSAEPIEVLLIIPGGRELEQRLHALFCEDRISKQISERNYQKIVAETSRQRSEKI